MSILNIVLDGLHCQTRPAWTQSPTSLMNGCTTSIPGSVHESMAALRAPDINLGHLGHCEWRSLILQVSVCDASCYSTLFSATGLSTSTIFITPSDTCISYPSSESGNNTSTWPFAMPHFLNRHRKTHVQYWWASLYVPHDQTKAINGTGGLTVPPIRLSGPYKWADTITSEGLW